MTISFDNRTAIVTGAGGGLGRAYALDLAARGAKVVVNDLGGARDGTGSSDAAAKVVEEIAAAGGTAIANGGSVTDEEQMNAMVAEAKEAFGSVDILINNAGILRDKSFAKMTMDDWKLVIDVHLNGSAICTKAVWETMREQAYGRILNTASSTGLYGNFGQANYGAAKLGLAGFTKTLAIEGAKYNIKVNTIAPIAATRMTEDIMPPAMFEQLGPDNVAPAAVYLVSEDAPSNMIVGAGGGFFHAAYVTMTEGVALPEDKRTAEGVAEVWEQVVARTEDEQVPQAGNAQGMQAFAKLQALAG